MDARAGLHWFLICGAIGDGGGVEDYQVSICALLHAAFLAGGGSGALEHLGGHQGHFAESVHEGERLLFADVLGEDASVRSGVAGVAFRAVAGDHHERVRDYLVDHFLRVREDQDAVSDRGAMEFVETGFGEVLAGFGEDEVVVVDAEFLAEAGIEQSGVDGGHTGYVGVGFRGHIEAAGASAFDQGQTFHAVPSTGAVDVHDVQWNTGDGGGTDHFADCLDGGAGFNAAGAAHVGVDREMSLRGEPEHVYHFETSGAGGVLNTHADRESSCIEFGAETLFDGGYLFRRGGLIGGRTALGEDLGNAGVGCEVFGGQSCSEDKSASRGMTG